MIDKEVFRKTEKKLYNYFGKDKKMISIKTKIELLEKQIELIENKIRNTDIKIPIESRSITFEEKVQSSGDCCSYAEKATIRIIEGLEKELARKKEEIALLEEEVRNIEAENSIIEYNLQFLSEEDKKFLKLKYGEGKRDWQIGQELNISQPTANRIRQRLVEDVSRWEDWLTSKRVNNF